MTEADELRKQLAIACQKNNLLTIDLERVTRERDEARADLTRVLERERERED